MEETQEYKFFKEQVLSEMFQQSLKRISKENKKQKILLYGAGVYFDAIADNIKLNDYFDIVGVSDLKFENAPTETYKGFKAFKPSELKKLHFDKILVSAINFDLMKNALNNQNYFKINHLAISYREMKKQISLNYENVLKNLKDKKSLRVAFLVNESSKWQYQSLYEQMEKDPYFEPFVLVTPLYSVHTGIDKTRESLSEMYNFYKAQKLKVEYAYDEEKKEYLDLRQFEPDIIFYQQPWYLIVTHELLETSSFALSFYCPYAISESSFIFKSTEFFCPLLYRHFVVDESAKKQYLNYYKSDISNLEIVGHPKLDAIFQINKNHKKKSDKKTIIYAPHHSFRPPTLQWGTFEWSGFEVLKLARENPQFNWVIKPHPWLKIKLLDDNIMSEEEYQDYFAQWEKIGSVVEGGNYFELFAESDLMITDCGSFLVEYLITEKPLIHLDRKEAQEQSILNQKILKCYYSAKNAKELNSAFTKVAIENVDTFKQKREKMLKELNFENSTSRIINHIKNNVMAKEIRRKDSMSLLNYLKANDAQKQIDKVAKKYKGKKVVIYGAGEYFQCIEQNYDLSKLNIVAISDLKFATDKTENKTKFTPIAPDELKKFDFDVLIIALVNDLSVLWHIDAKILKGTKNEKNHIVPLISPTFSYIIKLFFKKV